MNPQKFERKTRLTSGQAIRVLRVNRSLYYRWRRCDSPTPAYIQASMNAHIAAMELGWVPLYE